MIYSLEPVQHTVDFTYYVLRSQSFDKMLLFMLFYSAVKMHLLLVFHRKDYRGFKTEIFLVNYLGLKQNSSALCLVNCRLFNQQWEKDW